MVGIRLAIPSFSLLYSLWLSGVCSLYSTHAFSDDKRRTITAQAMAFAPNAGGQNAYSLRYGTNDYEVSAFSNQYLMVGNLPLTGVFYDFRAPLCDDSCFWQFYLQGGPGLSNAGLMADISWVAVIPLLPLWLPTQAPKYFPALRLDITNQFVFIRSRAVTWSYPLWLGISVPF